MRKTSIGIFLIGVSLFSCTPQNSNKHLSAVLQSLNLSNNHIEENNKLVYAALNERLKDPITHSKATKWNPKAKAIQLIIDSTINYIDQLRIELRTLAGPTSDEANLINSNDYRYVEELFIKKGKGDELANKLYAVKNRLTNTLYPQDFGDDPSGKKYYQQAKIKLTKELLIGDTIEVERDSIGSARNHYTDYFTGLNTMGAILLLTKIQNDVLLSEHLLINFIINQTNVHLCGFGKTLPLVMQNSTILKSGQEIEITAAMGCVDQAGQPTFTINGQVTEVSGDGFAIYKLKLKQGAGNYTIPVKVEYTEPDGSPMSLTKQIKYQVVQ